MDVLGWGWEYRLTNLHIYETTLSAIVGRIAQVFSKSTHKICACIINNEWDHPLPISLPLTLYTHFPGRLVLLQTHRYFVSPMLDQKSLANAVSPTGFQSNGIRPLLTSVTFNPPMFQNCVKTHLYEQYYQ